MRLFFLAHKAEALAGFHGFQVADKHVGPLVAFIVQLHAACDVGGAAGYGWWLAHEEVDADSDRGSETRDDSEDSGGLGRARDGPLSPSGLREPQQRHAEEKDERSSAVG